MRYALLADIHANLEALSAVLDDVRRAGGVSEYWVLGDTVNYGAEPSACLEILINLPSVVIAGNHDLAATGQLGADHFNADAAAALAWTARTLKPDDIEYLKALPLTLERQDYTLVHGSPRRPVLEYLTSAEAAAASFELLKTRHAVVGHTHVPAAFELDASGEVRAVPIAREAALALGGKRFIINPGSVGQPRDGDPRAGWALYDAGAGTIAFHRVIYDVGAAQRKIIAAGLPEPLAARLERGY